MPLLEGKFDPQKLNAPTVAEILYGDLMDMSESQRQSCIDAAQMLLDQLWERKIIF